MRGRIETRAGARRVPAMRAAAIVAAAVLLGGGGGEPGAAPKIEGPVTRVVEADTLWMGGTKVRLCGIEAPRSGQPGYHHAIAYLSVLVKGKMLQCIPVGAGTRCDDRPQPRDGDAVMAQCFAGSLDIGARMIATGHATARP